MKLLYWLISFLLIISAAIISFFITPEIGMIMLMKFVVLSTLFVVFFFGFLLALTTWQEIEFRKTDSRELDSMLQQTLKVKCEFCDKENIVPIVLTNDRNDFNCIDCGNSNGVHITAKVVRLS